MEKRDGLVELLTTTARKYMDEFGLRPTTPGYYPKVMKGQKGITISIGGGGQWIELWKMMGAGFISGNNLDGYRENAVAFNVGADVLEAVDETILAPRISIENDRYILTYPLPAGVKTIPKLKDNERFIKRFYEVGELNTNITITEEEGERKVQRITNPQGVITIENDICQGTGFKEWNAARASWVIAKLMVSSIPIEK